MEFLDIFLDMLFQMLDLISLIIIIPSSWIDGIGMILRFENELIDSLIRYVDECNQTNGTLTGLRKVINVNDVILNIEETNIQIKTIRDIILVDELKSIIVSDI